MLPIKVAISYNFNDNNKIFLIYIFSRVFRRKIRAIKKGLSGRAAGEFLVNVLVNLFADLIFSQSIQPAFFKFQTWLLQGLCFQVMPCSFQLVPNFLVKMHFLEIGIFLYLFFTNFCVYSITPKLFKVFGWNLMGM